MKYMNIVTQEMAANVVGEQRFSSTQSQAQSEGDTEMGI